MKAAVVMFPGSNCDHDAYHVLKHVLGVDTRFLWHQDSSLAGADLVVVPGGFSYGDYLRAGALASLSPMLDAVREHAERGGLVLGICNGFQILVETGLLPGALRRNSNLRFRCQDVCLRVERNDTPFTGRYASGQVLRMPIAHAEGNYEDSDENLDRLEAAGQVVFRYVDASGEVAEGSNPNGSARAIAGLVNARGNVLGMMPHPERAAEEILGSTDGLALFESAIAEAGHALGVAS